MHFIGSWGSREDWVAVTLGVGVGQLVNGLGWGRKGVYEYL